MRFHKMAKFTDQQMEVINHNEGPALVLAGAGSGKSTTLIGRISRLINEGVSPAKILSISFSAKSVLDLKEKAAAKFPEKDLKISTFHSLGYSIIKEFPRECGFFSTPRVAGKGKGNPQPKWIIKDILQETRMNKTKGINWPKADIGSLMRTIGLMKRSLVTVAESEDWLAENEYDEFERIAKVYQEYQRTLRNNGAVDFDDMLMAPVLAMQKHAHIQKAMQKFEYIMVDECQDSNVVQYTMMNLIKNAQENLMWIGDDFQSIYSFTGATPEETVYKFRQNYPTGQVYMLEDNFRSQQQIVDLSQKLIDKMDNPYAKKIRGVKKSTIEPTLTVLETVEEEAEFVIEEIKALTPKTGKKRYSKNAVLYRTNKQARAIEDSLIQAEIPYVIHGGFSFYNRKEIKDVLAFVEASYDNNANDAFLRIMNIPSIHFGKTTRYLGKKFAEEMERKARGGSLYKAMVVGPLKNYQKNSIKDLTMVIKHIQEGQDIAERIEKALEIAYSEYIVREYGLAEEEGDSRLASIEELKKSAANYGDDWKAYNKFIKLVQDQEKNKNNPDFDGVHLMTVHKSKGLEFPNVFSIGFMQGTLPFMFQGELEKNAEQEERRIAYVSITRAIDRLYVTASRTNHKGEQVEVSQFIDEMELTIPQQ